MWNSEWKIYLCVRVPQFASCVRVYHVKYVWVVKYICQSDTEVYHSCTHLSACAQECDDAKMCM